MSEEPNAESYEAIQEGDVLLSRGDPGAFMMPHPSCSQHLTNDLIGR
ncbi:hypothetical protein [Bifidobacterium pseudolongum]|nr:hypothetical protein [Bifidobacterium pseudolongum]UNP92117.1 hypothetical protein MPY69_04325 [Bifidobacterium pseudolongum subsp. pseudolongum]WCA40161.1 hypothetical protein PGB23_04125 [Bifidobacterium pseudolongum subsp. pseudolongum]